jgi:hypothetical protein
MTDDRMALVELLQKSGDGDFLRAVAEAVLQILMEADVEGLIGAGRHERTGDQLNYRNGGQEQAAKIQTGGPACAPRVNRQFLTYHKNVSIQDEWLAKYWDGIHGFHSTGKTMYEAHGAGRTPGGPKARVRRRCPGFARDCPLSQPSYKSRPRMAPRAKPGDDESVRSTFPSSDTTTPPRLRQPYHARLASKGDRLIVFRRGPAYCPAGGRVKRRDP